VQKGVKKPKVFEKKLRGAIGATAEERGNSETGFSSGGGEGDPSSPKSREVRGYRRCQIGSGGRKVRQKYSRENCSEAKGGSLRDALKREGGPIKKENNPVSQRLKE